MIITAKYASTCSCCRAPIAVGTRIEWAKGAPAKHVECAPQRSAVAAVAAVHGARGHRGRKRECEECGEYAEPGTRCWETGFVH